MDDCRAEIRSTFDRHGRPTAALVMAISLVLSACGFGQTADPAPSNPTPAAPQDTPSTVATPETDGEPVEIIVATGFNGVQYADIYVSIEEGFFADENISVGFLATATAPGTALLTGESHINSGQPAATYIPNAEGAGIVAIYSPAATFETWWAKDPIRDVPDLADQTMGVFSLQDLDVIYTQWMLEQHGMTLDDVELVASGPTAAKLAAVIADAVDVAPLYAPSNFVAEQEGLNLVFDTRDLEVGQIPTFYIVLEEWARENEATVLGFIRALNRAHDWLFDGTNRDRAIEIIAQYTEVETPLVEASYDLYFTTPGELYSVNGEWDRSVVELMAEELVEIGLLESDPVPYETTVAPQYRDAVLDE